MDINKVWVSGVAVTRPVLTRLSSRTQFTSFMLQVNEQFTDRSGVDAIHPNIIQVESLGKAAELTTKRVREGQRYMIDGYLRCDNVDGVRTLRIRTYAIYKEESRDSMLYNQGLEKALEVLKKSRDLPAAKENLKTLIEALDNNYLPS